MGICQLEVLRHCLPASIRQTLNQLPKSLDDTYLRVLRQIPEVNQAHAHRMLECLVVAVRPLSVEELAELLAFEFDAAPGGIPKYCPSLRLDNQTQAVLSTCSSLVTIIDERWTGRHFVQFSHFSVKEFLVSNRLAPSIGDISRYHIRLGPAHTTLTQACLGLLLRSDNQITEGIVEDSPLAGYAAEHWVEHAQFDDVVSCVKDGMETLFDPDKPHFEAWVGIYDIDPEVSWPDTLERASPLYYSVLCGFYDLAEHLAIKHPQYVNDYGGHYRFPLLAAQGQGHGEVAELLLKHGADIDVREATGKTMLLVVLSEFLDHDKPLNMVDYLLTHGADVNAQDDTFTSPLHLAEKYCMREVVTILLKHGADVNSQDSKGKTPLHCVLEFEQYYDDDEKCNHVRLLLEHGADVNIQDRGNRTPLLLARKLGWFRTVCVFIEHGADADTENKSGGNLLHELVLSDGIINKEGEALDHALLLLKHGVEINKRDKHKDTPLHLAIAVYWFRLAGILLEHGADANAENGQGMTPLHKLLDNDFIGELIEDNSEDVLNLVLLLFKHGAEVNKRNKGHQTPLSLAIQRNRFRLAGILLEHGADASEENDQGMTPLHMMSQTNIKDDGNILNLVLLLLKYGAEMNKWNKDHRTPLHLAIRRNRIKLAEILLEHGADAIAEDNRGQTPLHALSDKDIYSGDDVQSVVLLLLTHGTELNSRDKKNQTPLHRAIRRNRFKLAETLLVHGADANAKNDQSQTPLHILSKCHIKSESNVALTLLRHGAEVNSRDKNNQTPLHLAIPRNRFELAGILLEHGADADAPNYHGKTPLRALSENWSYQGGDPAMVPGLDRQEDGNKTSFPEGIGEEKQSSPKLLLSFVAQIFPWRTTPVISWCNKYHGGTTAPGSVVLVLSYNHSNVARTSKRNKMRTKMRTN